MQKELKRLRKQKDELIGQISQLETHNKKLSDLLVKYTKGEGPMTKSIPIVPAFQTTTSDKPKEQTIMN